MSLKQYFYQLSDYFPYLMIGMSIIAILLMVYVIYVAYKASKKGQDKKNEGSDNEGTSITDESLNESMPPLGGRLSEYLTLKGFFHAGDLSLSFLHALQMLRSHLPGYDYKYQLPWYMVIGAENSGKSTLINQSDIKQDSLFADFNAEYPGAGCRWSFFNQAVVLDISGKYFINKQDAKDEWQGWRALLALLARYRSRYPINGIILTIPATELYGANKLSPEQLNERARFISNKLLRAQNSLGLSLPIYVVITKCDLLAGFQELAHNLPAEKRFNMLGWSNPYNLEAAYISDWIDEAFNKVVHTLENLRLQLFTKELSPEVEDGIFMLPQSVKSLKDNVSIYLDQLFKHSSYQEALAFRGIYFTGQVSEFALNKDIMSQVLAEKNANDLDKTLMDTLVEPIMPFAPSQDKTEDSSEKGSDKDKPKKSDLSSEDTENNAGKKLYFIHDLLTRKVFHEQGLAQPISYRLQSANKSLNFLKLSLLLFIFSGAVGLTYTHNRFKTNKNYLSPILDRISMVLSHIQETKAQPQLTINLLNSHGRDLLNMMSQVQGVKFNSIFVPSSWFSSINSQLRNTLSVAYEHIILRSIYLDLLNKLNDLIRLRPGVEDISTQLDSLLLPLTSPEFLLVKYYSNQLNPLIKTIEKYNNLKSSSDAKSLDHLVEFCFGIKLPEDFVNDYQHFRTHLVDLNYPQISLPSYSPQAQQTLGILWDHLLDSIVSTKNPKALVQSINQILSQFQNTVAINPEIVNDLREFSKALSLAIPHLGPEGATWIDLPYFNPGAPFSTLIEEITANQLLGNSIIQPIAHKTSAQFKQFILELTRLNNMLIDPQTQQNKKIYPSSGLFMLQKSLVSFFKQPFMQPFIPIAFDPQVPNKQYIMWNKGFLNEALRQINIFSDFEEKKLNTYPPSLQPILKLIAHQNIQDLILTNLAKAKELADDLDDDASETLKEEQLRQRIKNFTAYSKDFLKLLEFYKKNTSSPYFVELKNFLANYAISFLQQASMIIEKSNLYQVKDNNFQWWTGDRNVAFQAFGVHDKEDLRNVIKQHHARIRLWSLDYIAPLVQFLKHPNVQSPEINPALLAAWDRIIDQLKAYDLKKPDSSVSKLDAFLTNELNDYNLENIFKKIPYESIMNPSGDYFLEHIRFLKENILSKAEVLKRQKSIKLYNKIRQTFNENLSDKFPFVTSVPSNKIAEAEPQYIKYFFKIFDEAGGKPEEILDQVHQLGPQAGDALQFLNEMKKVRAFFEDYISGHPDPDAPVFDVSVDFRMERNRERNANMILDWFFMPDEVTKIESLDKERNGRWKFGNQIEMGFRWAEGAPTGPAAQSNDPFMLVTNKTARFVYQGRWSLLWMIRFQHNRGDSMQNPRPYTLRFVVPTSDNQQAVVYNKVTIKSVPKGDEPGKVLTVPSFPRAAPPLDPSLSQMADKPILVEQALGRSIDVTPPEVGEGLDQGMGMDDMNQPFGPASNQQFNQSSEQFPGQEQDNQFDPSNAAQENFGATDGDDIEIPETIPEEEDDMITEESFDDNF